jgi:hypothetical protein
VLPAVRTDEGEERDGLAFLERLLAREQGSGEQRDGAAGDRRQVAGQQPPAGGPL